MEQDNRRRPSEPAAPRRERPTAPDSRRSRSGARSGSRDQRQYARARQEAARSQRPEADRPARQSSGRSRSRQEETARRRSVPVEAERTQSVPEESGRTGHSRQRTTYYVPQQDRNLDSAYQRRTGSSGAARHPREKRPHRVYNTNFGFKFLTMLAVVAVIIISMMIFFKIKHIEVVLLGVNSPTAAQSSTRSASDFPPADKNAPGSGSSPAETGTGSESPQPEASEKQHSYYTAEEIIEASGIQLDSNLLSLSKSAVASRIHAALPYVDQIQIKKELPGTVVITVSETEVTYGIQDAEEGWWLMSRDGRILEPATTERLRGHLLISGMQINVPQVGDWFKPSSGQGADMSEIGAKQAAVLAIIPALEQTPFVKQIERVDVSTSYNVTLWYGTRYEIRLGTVENLPYKFRYLETILQNDEVKRRSGTIDLTFTVDNKVHFIESR